MADGIPKPGKVGRIEIPGLDMQPAKTFKKVQPKGMTDEVQAILDGLRLEKQFFGAFLDKDVLDELAPNSEATPTALKVKREKTMAGTRTDKSMGPTRTGQMGPTRTKRSERTLNRAKTTYEETDALANSRRLLDFDVYLGEALLPVLAQSLDALCRQRNRMDEQGDRLDPKVRARFNPLTFLAQQLLRRHPKCATTPRRSNLYKNFTTWADLERGKREMLRRVDIIEQAFGGFVLRGTVSQSSIPLVLSAIDDTLFLNGVVKTHPEMVAMFHPEGTTNFKSISTSQRSQLFRDTPWTWERFWQEFSSLIMTNDVVRYSDIERGMELKKEAVILAAERTAAFEKEQEKKKQRMELQRRLIARYTDLHQLMQEDAHIKSILTGSLILTGDDVRPGDAGYEFEVPPKGRHVTLLAELLRLLGFQSFALPGTEEDGIAKVPEDTEMWWDNDLAAAWTTIQELQGAEMKDGVVEKDVLEQVLVAPVGFVVLRHKVEDELERQSDPLMEDDHHHERHRETEPGPADLRKPTFEELSFKLGMTMARMQWLHALFETFLPHESGSDVHPTCRYPDNPAAIPKTAMRELIREIHPHLTDSEFEARFARIDSDGSGVIEFDEFVNWVREDEVHVVGGQKMTFEELSHHLNEGVDFIQYLYTCWCGQFTMLNQDADVDDYPNNPKSMAKKDVRELITLLTPSVTDEDFEVEFSQVDTLSKGVIDFDEFLEVLDQEAIPLEFRETIKTSQQK
mmetsp:Transcript_52826/g.123584  ORF Transcript_52826/g.123584 Transcript_52826/m.123584 type:complete len:741 (+) Transcript_52826:52-2274(+)